MRKIITFCSALFLWQTMAVAQNYLRLFNGDTVTDYPIASLDSITFRDKNFYGGEWEYMGEGTYTFSLIFDDTAIAPVYKCRLTPNDKLWQFKMTDWMFPGYDLVIDYDASTQRCHVKPQATGYYHNTYGMIMVADVATYTGNEEAYISTYNEESGLFELCVVYYVDAGIFGYGYEALQINKQNSAPTRTRALGNIKFEAEDIKPTHSLRKATIQPINTTATERKNTSHNPLQPVIINENTHE